MLWVRITLAVVVTGIWLTGYVLAYVGERPEPPTELSVLMAFVLSWAFGGTVLEVTRRAREVRKREDDDER